MSAACAQSLLHNYLLLSDIVVLRIIRVYDTGPEGISIMIVMVTIANNHICCQKILSPSRITSTCILPAASRLLQL